MSTELRRLEVKYVRDKAKSLYEKDTECFICGSSERLELHHFYSLTELWDLWKKDNNIEIKSTDDIINYREDFISEHHKELYEEVVTLCHFHHMDRLHKIYGAKPKLHTAKKQKNWCNIRRNKEYGNGVV